MNIFTEIKKKVTAGDVAERYGLKVSRNRMACCPFHPDRHPSMKVDKRYYCFGCGATGDAVDLAAKLLNVSAKEAAEQIAYDFGIVGSFGNREVSGNKTITKKKDELIVWMDRAIAAVSEYAYLLHQAEIELRPEDPDAEWHPLFVEALQQGEWPSILLEMLENTPPSDYAEAKRAYGREVERIAERLV